MCIEVQIESPFDQSLQLEVMKMRGIEAGSKNYPLKYSGIWEDSGLREYKPRGIVTRRLAIVFIHWNERGAALLVPF